MKKIIKKEEKKEEKKIKKIKKTLDKKAKKDDNICIKQTKKENKKIKKGRKTMKKIIKKEEKKEEKNQKKVKKTLDKKQKNTYNNNIKQTKKENKKIKEGKKMKKIIKKEEKSKKTVNINVVIKKTTKVMQTINQGKKTKNTKIKKLNKKEKEIVRLLYIGNKKAKQIRDVLKMPLCEQFNSDADKYDIMSDILDAAYFQKRKYYQFKNIIVEYLYKIGKAKCEKYHEFEFENGIGKMYLYEIGDYSFHCNSYYDYSHLEENLKDGGELGMIGSKIEGEANITFEEIIDKLSIYIYEESDNFSLNRKALYNTFDQDLRKKVTKVQDVPDIIPFCEILKKHKIA